MPNVLVCSWIGIWNYCFTDKRFLKAVGTGFDLFWILIGGLGIAEVAGVPDEVAEKYGFEKVSEEFIKECKSRATLFRHKKTGAEVMSVSNDDENKVFGIVFRTPP